MNASTENTVKRNQDKNTPIYADCVTIMQAFHRARAVSAKLARMRHCLARQSSQIATQPKLRIVFGSQTGTAEAFANDLEFDASENFDAEIIDAMDFSVQDLVSSPAGTVNALVVAVYGEGEPTDNAKKFMKELSSTTADLSACNYAVFGLGNSHCFQDRFNVVGIEMDQLLHARGAKRVIDIGLGDASKNISAEFTDWKIKLLGEMERPVATSATVSSSLPSEDPTPSSILHNNSSVNACSSKAEDTGTDTDPCGVAADIPHDTIMSPNSSVPLALSVRQQAMAPSERPIFFSRVSALRQMFTKTDEINSSVLVSYDLSASRPLDPAARTCSFKAAELTRALVPGDHIGVFAPQAQHVVETFVTAANISQSDLEKPVEGVSSPPSITFRQILTWQVQLTGIVPLTAVKVLHRWANENHLNATAAHLQALIQDYDNLIRAKHVSVTTVLDMIPLGPTFPKIPLVSLLKVLPAISPRLYSMVQNPKVDPLSVSMLCRLNRYRDGRSCIVSGLCSSYLAERVHVNDHAAMFFRESNFHLPADPKQPVIMISGGTGIAPFMSFLKERSRLVKELGSDKIGPAYLYYGCRNSDEYMFRAELLEHLADGSLSKLVVSFSSRFDESDLQQHAGHENEMIRDVVENITDSVNADVNLLVDNVKNSGSLYVCGGAGNFGKAVRNAVETIVDRAYPPLVDHDQKAGSSDTRSGVRLLIQQNRYFEDLAD